jgi:CRP/FNR family cyclic AMP-dependent transcriptional regulator
MKDRFTGPAGSSNLINALLEQRLVQHDGEIAKKLADKGEVVEFPQGETLIAQGASDDSALFILNGEANVFVNNRQVATRGPRDCVGEMSIIDPAAPRSATVKAKTTVVAIKVPSADFQAIGDAHPPMWRAAARIVSERLRQRERFHRPENHPPIMFVGSSVEGLPVAREVQEQMKHDKLAIKVWTGAVFGPSGVPVDDLLKQVEEADFALFVFGPDDKVASRDHDYDAPRDNVIFEMGLFMGRLGRQRTFMLKEQNTQLKISSDLLGITPITYICRANCKLADQIGPACNEIRKAASDLGAL